MSEKANAFESLAGICKFIAMEKFDPKFYEKHFDAIEVSNSFSRVLASNYPELDLAFRESLPLPTDEGSKLIQEAFEKTTFPEDKIEWIDSQMTQVLRVLYPLFDDREFPEAFEFSRHSIVSAFE